VTVGVAVDVGVDGGVGTEVSDKGNGLLVFVGTAVGEVVEKEGTVAAGRGVTSQGASI
jgi:hypothetical protein